MRIISITPVFTGCDHNTDCNSSNKCLTVLSVQVEIRDARTSTNESVGFTTTDQSEARTRGPWWTHVWLLACLNMLQDTCHMSISSIVVMNTNPIMVGGSGSTEKGPKSHILPFFFLTPLGS